MKTTLFVVLLALSLATNAALFFSRPAAAPGSSTAGATVTKAATAPGQAAATATAGKPSPAEIAQLVQVRTLLQSGDLKGLVERLRAAGFSPSMIRSIVASQIYEQFAARRKALLGQQEEQPYWSTQRNSFMDPKTMSAMREMSREQTSLLKELLGPDGMPGGDEREIYLRRQFGTIPREKIDQLQNITSDYSDLRNQVYAAANGVMLPEDREKLALLEKEQRADIATLLSPQELEAYELRSSSTANTLRSQLSGFKPTEAEFIALFQATRAAEEKFGSIGNGATNPNQLRQVQTAVLEQAQSLLSTERYAELKQATDPAYQMINRLVARLELPASAAPQVVSVQQDIMKRAGAIRGDQSLTTDQRNAQMSTLLQEANTNLGNVLGGQRGLEAYKQYGGQWLQSLQPRPTTPPRG